MKRGLLLFGILILIAVGYKTTGIFSLKSDDDISGVYRNVINQVSQVAFWNSKITNNNMVEPSHINDYQRAVLNLFKVFSDKMYAFQYQGTQTIEQFMISYPKTTKEGVKLTKDVQGKMIKIASDISKVDFPKDIVVNGKKYNLGDEQVITKEIKDNYVKGFTLTAEGYGYIASYIQTRNINDFNKMRNSFAEADKYFFKAIEDLETLKYKDLINDR